MPLKKLNHFRQKTFASLAVRNYRLFFWGQATSVSGSWMQTIALGWLVLLLGGNGTVLGTVIALQFLPLLLGGMYAGVIVDRYPTRHIVLWAQIAFAIVALVMTVFVYFSIMQLWMLYFFGLLLGIGRAFDNPSRQAFFSELAGPEHLKNAVSLNSTINNLGRVIGPAIGGVLIAGIGIAFCFFFNFLSYLVIIYFLTIMNEDEFFEPTVIKNKPGLLREGLAYVRSEPFIMHALIMIAIVGTFTIEWQVTLPLIAKEVFGGNASAYALLMSALGCGAVIGGVYAAGRRQSNPRHIVRNTLLFGMSIVASAFMPSLVLTAAALVPAGFFMINATSLANTAIQTRAIPEFRGRVMSLWSVAMAGSTPIGGTIIGILSDFLGARWGLGLGGIAAICAAFYAHYNLKK